MRLSRARAMTFYPLKIEAFSEVIYLQHSYRVSINNIFKKHCSYFVFSKITVISSLGHLRKFGAKTMAILFGLILVILTLSGSRKVCMH
jgi:hypothetical protein